MKWRRTIVLFGLMALLVGACGGDSADNEGTEAEPTTEQPADEPATTAAPDPTTTEPAAVTTTTAAESGPEGVIVELTQGAALQPYGTEDITAGQVVVYWYRGAAENYVAVYTGDGIAGAQGQKLCPGNSIFTNDDWIHISNAPSEEGACEWGPEGVGSLQVCDHGVWIYETKIPNEEEGELWGSLEWTGADGATTGLTSITLSGAGMAELEAGLSSYSIPPWYTSDGATVINCEAPAA